MEDNKYDHNADESTSVNGRKFTDVIRRFRKYSEHHVFCNWEVFCDHRTFYHDNVQFDKIPFRSRIQQNPVSMFIYRKGPIEILHLAYLIDGDTGLTIWGAIDENSQEFVDLNGNRYSLSNNSIIMSDGTSYPITRFGDRKFFNHKLGIHKSPMHEVFDHAVTQGKVAPSDRGLITIPYAVVGDTENFVNGYIYSKQSKQGNGGLGFAGNLEK